QDMKDNNKKTNDCQTLIHVIKFGSTFKEDIEFLKTLKKSLGSGNVSDKIILVMSNRDTFERVSAMEGGITFTDWCKREGKPFQDMMKECGNRIVLFDNMTDDEDKKTEQ
ncbi:hypothetical protein EGW08_006024, partial [Elysia chlorotica]